MAKKLLKSILRRIAWGAAYGLFTPLGLHRRGFSGSKKPPILADVQSILAIRLDLMGDLVFTLPALRALKDVAPSARLTVLVQPYAMDLARSLPFIDRVVTADVTRWRRADVLAGPAWEEIQRTRQLLLKESYDLCISFYGRVGASAALLSGARYLVGYLADGYPGTFDLGLTGCRYQKRRHEAEYCLDLVRALVLNNGDSRCDAERPAVMLSGERSISMSPPDPRGDPSLDAQDVPVEIPYASSRITLPMLVIDPLARAKVDQLLASVGICPEDQVVAIHPGALNMAAKRWIPERWAAVADRLQKELRQKVVLVGSSSEIPLTQMVSNAMVTPVINLSGKTSVAELGALLDRCKLFLGGDSGPLHVASALGVPSVSVYGPTDPALTGPLGTRARIILSKPDCAPCYGLQSPPECLRGDLLCMAMVSVEQVYEAAREMITGGSAEKRGEI